MNNKDAAREYVVTILNDARADALKKVEYHIEVCEQTNEPSSADDLDYWMQIKKQLQQTEF